MVSASVWFRRALVIAVCAALAGCGGYYVGNPRGEAPPPASPAAAQAPLPPNGSYTVQRGDTIYVVARHFGVTVRGLIEANGLVPPFQLTPGQELRMPANGEYVVVKGDTLTYVARKTGVEFATLARINGLHPPYTIRIGQRLTLPVGAQVQTASATQTDVIESPLVSGPAGAQPGAPLSAAQPRVDATPLAAPPPRPQATPLAPPPPAQPAASAVPAPQPAMRDRTDSPPATKPMVITAPAPAPAPIASPQPAAAPPPAASPPAPQTVAAIEPPPAPMLRPANTPDFLWPVHGPVLMPFGVIAKGQRSDGVNIAVPKGTPVLAAADGIVAYAGNELSGFGNMILIKHSGTDYVTVYAHNDKLLVHRDEHVRRGQKIALSGDSGGVTQPQLLFELRQGVKPIDPQGLLPNELSPAVVPAAQQDPG